MAGGVKDVIAQAQKDHGDKIAHSGAEFVDYERIPFGVFPLDLATGGGIPEGKMSMIYGPESSGKTNIALKLMASYQFIYPDRQNIWIDAEHSFDSLWAARMGVDVDNLIIIKPDFAEQCVDIMEGLVEADDIGLVILDSVAALVPHNEIESDASKEQVGGNSKIVGKLCRKISTALQGAMKEDRYPTVFFINQRRIEIGKMFGNPEKYPGGNTLRHYCNIILRSYAKDKIIKAVDPQLPCIKESSVTLTKWKVPITSPTCTYDMVMIPHETFGVGDVADINTVMNQGKNYGLIFKLPKAGWGWTFDDTEFKTLVDIADVFQYDKAKLVAMRKTIIQKAVDEKHKLQQVEKPSKKGGIVWKTGGKK